MKPILFEVGETSFDSNGLGLIGDALSCEVTEEANAAYELTLTLPAVSRRYPDMQRGRLILARPNPIDRPQPFRIYRVTRPLKGAVSVFARHISYDLSGVVIAPLTASSAAAAVAEINAKALTPSLFTLATDLTATGEFRVETPSSERSLLGPPDQEGTLLQIYGGDLFFDRWDAAILAHRGTDRGFRVSYGVNMTDFKGDEDGGDVWTGILPYWTDGETVVRGAVQNAPGSFGWSAVKAVDLSSEFNERPSVQDLEAHGAAYVQRNGVGVPKTSFRLSFVPPGARGLKHLEELGLFDTVTVSYERLGIDVAKQVVRTVWDVLRDRYKTVEIGDRAVFVAEKIAAPVTNIARGAVGGGSLSKSVRKDIKDAKDLGTAAEGEAQNAIAAAAAADSKADAAAGKADLAWGYADANKDRFLGDLNAIVSALNANTTYSGFRASIKDKPM